MEITAKVRIRCERMSDGSYLVLIGLERGQYFANIAYSEAGVREHIRKMTGLDWDIIDTINIE